MGQAAPLDEQSFLALCRNFSPPACYGKRHIPCGRIGNHLFMRKWNLFFLIFSGLGLQGCSVVEGIFKAGMIWAFFLVGAVVVLVLWLYFRARK